MIKLPVTFKAYMSPPEYGRIENVDGVVLAHISVELGPQIVAALNAQQPAETSGELVKALEDVAYSVRCWVVTLDTSDAKGKSFEKAYKALKQAAARIEALEKALKENRWIPISATCPKKEETIFVLDARKDADIGYMNQYGSYLTVFGEKFDNKITNWMPIVLPEDAAGGGKNEQDR